MSGVGHCLQLAAGKARLAVVESQSSVEDAL